MICKYEGCNDEVKKNGYCIKHYYKVRRNLKPGEKGYKKCKVLWCENNGITRGYCNKHYLQIKNYIKPKKDDINEIIIHEDYAEIVLTNNKKVTGTAKISLNRLELVKGHKWSLKSIKEKYARSKKFLLHKMIMKEILGKEIPKNRFVTFKNEDTLDCRDENLYLVSREQLSRKGGSNSNRHFHSTTGCSYVKDKNRWKTYITVNKTYIHLGYFYSEKVALFARRNAEKIFDIYFEERERIKNKENL